MVPKKELLLIEDDHSLAGIMADILYEAGYRVRIAYTAEAGINEFTRHRPDLLLLDLALPDEHGLNVLRRLRGYTNIPVMVISGEGDASKIEALEAGADDYLMKPFHQAELIARITALMRRIKWTPQPEITSIEIGQVRMDLARRQVTVRGQAIHLTPIEYAILGILMKHAGEIVTYEELLTAVWGVGYKGDFSVLRVNMSRLRQKMEGLTERPILIETVPRKGYRIPTPGPAYH